MAACATGWHVFMQKFGYDSDPGANVQPPAPGPVRRKLGKPAVGGAGLGPGRRFRRLGGPGDRRRDLLRPAFRRIAGRSAARGTAGALSGTRVGGIRQGAGAGRTAGGDVLLWRVSGQRRHDAHGGLWGAEPQVSGGGARPAGGLAVLPGAHRAPLPGPDAGASGNWRGASARNVSTCRTRSRAVRRPTKRSTHRTHP